MTHLECFKAMLGNNKMEFKIDDTVGNIWVVYTCGAGIGGSSNTLIAAVFNKETGEYTGTYHYD